MLRDVKVRRWISRTGVIGGGILAVVALLTVVLAYQQSGSRGKVLNLEQLSWKEINQLDRQKTVFLITFGNLEEHGPHLPVGSDYFQAIGIRDGLVSRLRAAHADYNFVLFPIIPLGEGGANTLAMQMDHVGTYAVRFETLRNLAIDVGASIARNGFKNIFVIHFHGTPLHNIALSDAADFVSGRYKATMVNITSLAAGNDFFSPRIIAKHLGKNWEQTVGWEGHAGAAETSTNLYLKPQLVQQNRDLPPFVARGLAEVFRTSERPNWQGYWGAPSRASSALGKDLIDDVVQRSFQVAELALAGKSLSGFTAFPHGRPALPEAAPRNKMVLEAYDRETQEIQNWLDQREKPKR